MAIAFEADARLEKEKDTIRGGDYMSVPEMFSAPSPRNGKMKIWRAESELGTTDPIAFMSANPADNEEYKANSDGFKHLLEYYKRRYPDN